MAAVTEEPVSVRQHKKAYMKLWQIEDELREEMKSHPEVFRTGERIYLFTQSLHDAEKKFIATQQ